MSNFSREQAGDPSTTPELLAQIAHERPDLRATVAANPSAYPGLLTWLEGFGDPGVLAAIQSRSQGTPAPVGSAAPVPQPPAAPVGYGQTGTPHSAQAPGYGQPAAPGYGQAQDFSLHGHEPKPRKRGRGLLIGGIAAGALLLFGGGAFAANHFIFSKIKGADSPEAAATNLIEGIGSKDTLSIYGALSPAEVAQTKAQFDSFSANVDDNRSYGTFYENYGKIVDALDVDLEGLEVRVEPIEDGLAKVVIVDGTLTVDGDPGELASLSADLVDEVAGMSVFTGMGETPPNREEIESEAKTQLEKDLPYVLRAGDLKTETGEAGFLMAVEENGNWYVSPYLTMAEYAFVEMGGGERGQLPSADSIKSFGSPEDAAAGMTDAVIAFAGSGEISEFVAVLPLAERRVVALYGDTDFDGLGADLEGLEIKTNNFSTRDTKGDLANVVFDDFEMAFTDGAESLNLKLTGACVTLSMDPTGGGEICFDEAPLLKEFGLQDLSFVALKEGDSWFISPTSTIVDGMFTVGMRALDLMEQGKFDDQQWIEEQTQALQEYLMESGLMDLFMPSDPMDQFDEDFSSGLGQDLNDDFDFGENSDFGEDLSFDEDAEFSPGIDGEDYTQEEIDEMIKLSEEALQFQKDLAESFAN